MRAAVVYAAKSTEDTKGSIPDQIADGATSQPAAASSCPRLSR